MLAIIQFNQQGEPMYTPSIQSEIARKYIQSLIEQITLQYQYAKQERARLHEQEWDTTSEGEGFTVLGLMELYTTYITGYASQIVNKGWIVDLRQAINNLSEYRLLSENNFVDWYFTSTSSYPALIEYARNLDYLRLVIVEYTQRYQNDGSGHTIQAR